MNDVFKVLVVEDDRCLVNALARGLKGVIEGRLEIKWLTTVGEALEALAQEEFQLVITDYVLPGLRTGAEIVKGIERVNPRPPCLLMSGLPMPELIQELKIHSIRVPVLRKPFTIGEIQRLVDSALQSSYKPWRVAA